MTPKQVTAPLVLCAATIFAVDACREPTEMRVVVTTTIPCSHITNVSIAAGAIDGLETRPAGSQSNSCDASGNIGTLVVIPSGNGGGDVGIRVIAGLDGFSADECLAHGNVGGCVIARRALRFVDHSALTVPVSIEPDCRDVPCDPNSTCAKGACVPATTSCTGALCTIGGAPTDAGASDAAANANDAGPSRWLPLPAQAPTIGRAEQIAVWTGSEVWIWGGTLFQAGFAADGLRYSPISQAWTAIPTAPIAGGLRVADFASTQLVVWGSRSDKAPSDGARFDGAKWSKVSDPTAFPGLAVFAARDDHLLVWAESAKKLIVWGGNDAQSSTTLADGALYDPAGDSWSPMAASPLSPRANPGGVMVGGKLVVFSGYCGSACATAAVYDPSANSWSAALNVGTAARIPALAVTDGKKAYFWGGRAYAAGPEFNDLVIVDPQALTVDVRTGANAPSARASTGGWLSGGKIWLWGGDTTVDGGAAASLGDGASYDIASDRWTPMPTAGAPSPRRSHSITWTGTQAIVFGGRDPSGDEQSTGAIFVP